MKRIVVVNIGGLIISGHKSEILKTYALGSCVAVTMYCALCSRMAMAHIALPESKVDREKALALPGHFVDTAIPFMIAHVCKRGLNHSASLKVHLIGGSSAIWRDDVFRIGPRNLAAIERILKKNQIPYCKKETGGSAGKTVEAEVATGLVSVHINSSQYSLS